MTAPKFPKFDRVTKVAGRHLLDAVDFFFIDRSDWSKTALLRMAAMDPNFLRRVADGESFTTRAGDHLQAVMEKILKGDINRNDVPPRPVTKRRKPNVKRPTRPTTDRIAAGNQRGL